MGLIWLAESEQNQSTAGQGRGVPRDCLELLSMVLEKYHAARARCPMYHKAQCSIIFSTRGT